MDLECCFWLLQATFLAFSIRTVQLGLSDYIRITKEMELIKESI